MKSRAKPGARRRMPGLYKRAYRHSTRKGAMVPKVKSKQLIGSCWHHCEQGGSLRAPRHDEQVPLEAPILA